MEKYEKTNIVMIDNNNYPLVSVVVPTYNRTEVLPRALKSVLYQTYENVECIVVDAGSTDETFSYISKTFQQEIKSQRVKIFRNERVMNIGSALFEFCKREAGADISKITKWDIKLSLKLPQQKDTVSCGVFTVISSIRAMVLIKQNRFEDLCKSWTFPQLDSQLVDYRRSFAKILLDDHKEDEMQRFVDMFSLKP